MHWTPEEAVQVSSVMVVLSRRGVQPAMRAAGSLAGACVEDIAEANFGPAAKNDGDVALPEKDYAREGGRMPVLPWIVSAVALPPPPYFFQGRASSRPFLQGICFLLCD